jgi:FkbM family methyltransferase
MINNLSNKMLISLYELIQKYNIQFKGILHVGAHECEELNDYEKYISRNKILWVEALQDKVEYNKAKHPELLIEQAVISDKVEIVKFNRSNNGQSSSFLEFGLHETFHPHVKYVDSYEVETKMLRDILCNYNIDYNFLNLDIQGVELKALKGMEEYLSKVDYIYTEVNSDYVYKDCGLITEIDAFLKPYGLERVETKWCENFRWGDAFYIRK